MVWPYRDAAGARVSMWQVARRSALALPEVGRALLGGVPKDRAPDNVEESKKEKAFRRKRWAWIAGVSVSAVSFVFFAFVCLLNVCLVSITGDVCHVSL